MNEVKRDPVGFCLHFSFDMCSGMLAACLVFFASHSRDFKVAKQCCCLVVLVITFGVRYFLAHYCLPWFAVNTTAFAHFEIFEQP